MVVQFLNAPKDPILPGKSGEIKVKYDSNRVGPISKSVSVQSNAKSGTQTLQIKGNIAAKTGRKRLSQLTRHHKVLH